MCPTRRITAFLLNVLIFLEIVNAKKVTQPTNPRQIRSGSPTYTRETDRPKLDKIVKFLHEALLKKWFQDIGQACDPDLHKKWAYPEGDKDLLSTSFTADTSWHNKICNFLSYLDCNSTKAVCECATTPNRFDLKFVYEPTDGPARDDLKEEKKKRRCRVPNGELCNFVRILPTPEKAFPGIDFDIADQFDCITNSECHLDNEQDGLYYERCIPSEANVLIVRFWKLVLIQLMVLFFKF